MEPSSWRICHTKNLQKQTRGEKITAPQTKGVIFTKKIDQIVHSLFPNPSKNP
jgi:hypothetical protein